MSSREAQVIAAAIQAAGNIITPTVRDQGYISSAEANEYGKRVGIVAAAILKEMGGGVR